jgi:hypothetical protein
MNKKKVSIIIVVLVLAYNAFDFLKTLHNSEVAKLEKCKEAFIKNTNASDLIAEKYCECAMETP